MGTKTASSIVLKRNTLLSILKMINKLSSSLNKFEFNSLRSLHVNSSSTIFILRFGGSRSDPCGSVEYKYVRRRSCWFHSGQYNPRSDLKNFQT